MITETKVHTCRKCQSKEIVKDGTGMYDNQQYHCGTYGAYGVLEPREHYTEEEKERNMKAILYKWISFLVLSIFFVYSISKNSAFAAQLVKHLEAA